MRRDWSELNARARGLATRLLGRGELERLAGLGELADVARVLADRGLAAEDRGLAASLPAVERDVRRGAARRLELLRSRARGATRRALSALFGEEDVRSLTKLLRGARASVPPESRSSGLLPTPDLPDARLEELARAEDVEALVRRLDGGGHPLAPALVGSLRASGPDLAALETALLGAHLERARDGIPRGNGRLRAHVDRSTDLANAWGCLCGSGNDEARATDFLEGGPRIDRSRYVEILREEDPTRRRRAVGAALGTDGLGRAVANLEVPVSELEGRALGILVAEERSAARLDPLSAAPLILFFLAQRVELEDLRRILWGVALGAPPTVVRERLVTT